MGQSKEIKQKWKGLKNFEQTLSLEDGLGTGISLQATLRFP